MTYASAAPVFTALADPTRRRVFERVVERPRPVGELADGLPVSRPAVSQHLRVLEDAGLVEVHRDGRRRIARAAPHGLAELRAWVDHHWTGVLDAFAAAAAELEHEHDDD